MIFKPPLLRFTAFRDRIARLNPIRRMLPTLRMPHRRPMGGLGCLAAAPDVRKNRRGASSLNRPPGATLDGKDLPEFPLVRSTVAGSPEGPSLRRGPAETRNKCTVAHGEKRVKTVQEGCVFHSNLPQACVERSPLMQDEVCVSNGIKFI